jgi:tRNA dimethylallyltransferase
MLEGFAFPIAPGDKEVRERLEKLSASDLYSQLSNSDPAATSKIHANDKKRIIRALEVYELTGKPISELQKLRQEEPRRSVAGSEYILIGLDLPRAELYARINARVDEMMAKGLIGEVEGLLAKGYSGKLNSFQALGYKEAVEYLDSKWTREQMVEELKKRTRNFARRQLTWFRRFRDVHWFSPTEKDAIIALCQGQEHKK